MANDDLQFGVGNGVPVPGVESTEPVYVAPKSPGLSTESTIEKSSEEEEVKGADASIPAIPIPHQIIQYFNQDDHKANIRAGRLADLALSGIVSNMLDAWNDSIKELEVKRKAELFHPTPSEIRKSEERRAVSQFIDAVRSVNPAQDTVFGALVVGTLFIATGGGARDAMMIDTLSTSMVGVNPTSNAAPPINLFVSDMRAELGLLGAALMQGAMAVANSQTLFKLDGAKKEEALSAKNYAEQILTTVSSAQLTSLVSAIVTQNSDPSKPVDQALVKLLTDQIKLILLSSALVALYKSTKEGGTGWITHEEFLNLLAGNTAGPHKELMDKLVTQMNAIFSTMTGNGLSTKALLAAFYDSNPDLSVLTNPTKLFEKLHPYFKDPTEMPI